MYAPSFKDLMQFVTQGLSAAQSEFTIRGRRFKVLVQTSSLLHSIAFFVPTEGESWRHVLSLQNLNLEQLRRVWVDFLMNPGNYLDPTWFTFFN